MRQLQITLLFLLLICTCTTATIGFNFTTCKEADRKALLKFKGSFILDPSNYRLGSWVGQDCCNWKGVGCDNVTGDVIKLDLGSDQYPLPKLPKLEAREVNPALLELKYLTYLDLSFIYFHGSTFPELFGSMRQLQHLNLSSTHFNGRLPRLLGNLTELVVLDLREACSWSCEMERNSLEWVFKLQNLKYLDLSLIDLSQALDSINHLLHKLPSLSVLNLAGCGLGDSHQLIRNSTISSSPLQHLNLGFNNFIGPIPHFIQNLSSIRFLDLSSNHLHSPIPPWLGNKVDLRYLSLSGNNFNGPFPHFIQRLSFLTHLDLSANQFSSSIPSWLANKTYLEYLDLRFNNFNRVDGGITSIIGHLCRLIHLDLSYNQFQEEVSESHVNFSRCSKYDLEYLDMQNTNISGYLPIIGSLSSLQTLDLSHNHLETLPPSLGGLSSLVELDLSYNNLSVVNQVSLANLSSLIVLDISSNSLVLDLSPDWKPPFQLEYLRIPHSKLNIPFPKWILSQEKIIDLDLSDAGIFGPLPNNIGNAMPSLQSLRLANNDINGSIPRSLCGLTSLHFLDLQKNRLSGIIPDCWANSQISVVELSSNRLSGHIPNSLTKVGNLEFLSLSNNSLEGELPLQLSGSTYIFDVGRNNLHGKIPTWGFTDLRILILRENKFNGIIPLQLCSFYSLQIIDLASNNLVGTIPKCFGNFSEMGSITSIASGQYYPSYSDEWSAAEVLKGVQREYTKNLQLLVNLDLSCNNLVGVIPVEITSLSLLLGLNLSHNHLTRTIPKEIGKMTSLESLDLSFNNLSGSIPQSISALDYLSSMNLSFNNLQGQIPTGRHFQTLDDSSMYMENPDLCGDHLPKKCFRDDVAHSPTTMVDLNDEQDNKHEKMWFYLVIMSGFATGFWGVIGILVVNKKWRHACFGIAEEIADWIYVRVAVRIARANRGG